MVAYQSQKTKENLQRRLTESQKTRGRTHGPRSQEIQGDTHTHTKRLKLFCCCQAKKETWFSDIGNVEVLATLTEGDMIGTKCEGMIDSEERQPFKGCDEREERWGGNWREIWFTVSGITVFMS